MCMRAILVALLPAALLAMSGPIATAGPPAGPPRIAAGDPWIANVAMADRYVPRSRGTTRTYPFKRSMRTERTPYNCLRYQMRSPGPGMRPVRVCVRWGISRR